MKTRAADKRKPPEAGRWHALDDLRGLAVLVMIPVNVAAPFISIPAWFKHAPAEGLTLADLVVPAFLFSLGLSASFSYRRRRQEKGYGSVFLHALLRNALLVAFGIVGMLLADPGDRWGVLTMLGATGMLSFFFLALPPWPRLGAAFLLLGIVEALRPLGLGDLIRAWYDTGIAGPWGTFSLSFFAIAASSLGELLQDSPPRRRLLVLGAAAVVMGGAGAAALLLSPISKHLLSPSYILFTSGASCALLAGLVVLRETLRVPIPLLGSLGRNPLILYMLHALLGLGVLWVLGTGVPAGSAWAASLLVLTLCGVVALVLDRGKLYVKI